MAALLTENHLYEKAYQMVQIDGYDYLKTEWRVSLCSYAIADHGYEDDDFSAGICGEHHSGREKYSDVMLIYLCKYFNGPTKQMAELWKAAGEFQIDTFDLEERILTQMLYTTDYTPHMEEIYESYCAGGGRRSGLHGVSLLFCQYVSHGGRRRAGACVPPDQGALSDRGRC